MPSPSYVMKTHAFTDVVHDVAIVLSAAVISSEHSLAAAAAEGDALGCEATGCGRPQVHQGVIAEVIEALDLPSLSHTNQRSHNRPERTERLRTS